MAKVFDMDIVDIGKKSILLQCVHTEKKVDRLIDVFAKQYPNNIVVVRSGHTSRKLIRQSLKQLERAGCSLLGMVLNRENNQGKGYGKYGKYGKYGRYGI